MSANFGTAFFCRSSGEAIPDGSRNRQRSRAEPDQAVEGIGVAPYGIEYTEEGARLNRELFIRNGLNADNVLCEDFFSPALDRLAGTFDIVISFGFVEHFDDPRPVIKRHIEFCRPGGYVAIVIPNLQGVYYFWNIII